MTNLADMSEGFSDRENGGFLAMVRAAQVRISIRTLFLPGLLGSVPEHACSHVHTDRQAHTERQTGVVNTLWFCWGLPDAASHQDLSWCSR